MEGEVLVAHELVHFDVFDYTVLSDPLGVKRQLDRRRK